MLQTGTGLLTERLKTQSRLWLGEHLYRFFERLEDNFHRRSLTATESSVQKALSAQKNAVKQGKDEAFRLFANHINSAFDTKRAYEPGSHPTLDRLSQQLEKLAATEYENEKLLMRYFCRAIAPISVLAGFQHILTPLKLANTHRHHALTMFQGLLIQELSKLYQDLLDALPSQNQAHNVEAWIDHTKQQLAKKNLSTQERALSETRLQRLLKLNAHHNTKLNPALLEPSDSDLLSIAASVFQPLPTRRRLSSGILASLNTLQTCVSTLALKDRSAFTHPLHPARQACSQIINTLHQWDDAQPAQRQQFEAELKTISRKFNDSSIEAIQFTHAREQIDACCQHLLQSIKLNDKRSLNAEVGQKRLTRLRRKVHDMLDKKTKHIDLPVSIDNMLYGPMTTVILYHWLRHGSNSAPLRRSLQLIDDVLWYIQPHSDWSELRRAKAMSKDIETELSDGLQRINYGYHATQSLIEELHQLRLIASGRSASITRPDIGH
ncbi:Uncharacterised protein [Zhongshania aliphaticivorans]|uniref:Uncharacterized protein n=1 Tax=Zhongshania aliphaticivorans TaxID=1470434 RepID=A0A5S9N222_9GAMM|nr:DUF1631 family protein [Zhongshania aliphaticivorans]CAA0083112.1 Uncharacterised protein [Zhongshania aliphaticivorans]CAA0083691.1 Uncharacterised protein [Zhongshania aliphaticivorans]